MFELPPANLTNKELINFAIRKKLTAQMQFETYDMDEPFTAKVLEANPDNWIEYLTTLINDPAIRNPNSVGNLSLLYDIPKILEAGYNKDTFDELIRLTYEIRDVLQPKQVNYFYVKLDTGGLAGYNYNIKKRGEQHFPVLRLSLRINDFAPLDIYINPGEKIKNMTPKVLEMHTASGLIDECKNSSISMSDVPEMVKNYLRSHKIHNTNPNDNYHNHMVGYNCDFLRAFLKEQIPAVLDLCSPKMIDILELNHVMELQGRYDLMVHPQLHKDDVAHYFDSLAKAIKYIGR